METRPNQFDHKVVVPGLVDMAEPAFKEVGRKSDLRQAFWYRRTFSVDGDIPAFATLKIHKARYGTKVFLNGRLVGEHLPCFTPALLDVKPFLKGNGQSNELVIRVGANRESVPADMPNGWDFEKYLYIPGIYDSVELILCGGPRIVNVQTVPNIEAKTVRIVAEIENGDQAAKLALKADVTEAKGGKAAGSAASLSVSLAAKEQKKIELTIPIENCRLWSPEDPFLYQLTLTTAGDSLKTRFGMRSFTFDPKTKRAVLNGKPFIMRGTNVCIYRFFEDAARGDKPWREEWVRRLHQQFKSMHWDAIRYCIGFPPEIWYDIADEEGFLIQDEFPIWTLSKAPDNQSPVAAKIIPEYVEWMRQRWNHPCVVIWDGQNESHTAETGKAIAAVRDLDLSGRPWENGWAEPGKDTDCVESHPYLFSRTEWSKGQKPFFLKELATTSPIPSLQADQKKKDVAIIINEYDWLWLDREGNPTSLTHQVYDSLLGKNSTAEQRRLMRARCVAALTEFWRCHRKAAAVMHFCGLGYSRPGDKPRPEGGATSDDFIDLEKLTFEPNFARYVRDSFNPLGLMLDFWADQATAGAEQQFKVIVINDLYKDWKGEVRLVVMQGEKKISETAVPAAVAGLGQQTVTLQHKLPAEPGNYTLIAELTDSVGKTVRSLRDVKIVKPAAGL
jgi:hypothetical protein